MKVSEQEAVESAARELGVFLGRRKEQIARRWADAPLFRAVFTASRDGAVEACKAVVDALAYALARQGVDAAPDAGAP
ncbi:hypothetical protein ACF052_16440 [Streptomyces pilosus]|uniref:hypothetical protein n=1 Tax=Streptomyces pilosus TaxID=28893 RepID=UPI003597579D